MTHNFGAGPCVLPQEVFKQASQAVLEFNGTGLSILEISHRSPEFEAVVVETILLVKELLNVPEGYSVVLLQGGASLQFSMAPMNLLAEGQTAAYLNTGVWATKALKEVCRVYFKQNIFIKNGGDNNTSKGFLIPLTRLLNDIANNKQNDI